MQDGIAEAIFHYGSKPKQIVAFMTDSNMTTDEIIHSISTFLHEENPSIKSRLEPATNLLEEWFVDSVAILNLVTFLEEQFGIRFRRGDINSRTFATMESICDYVQSRQKEKA